MDSCVPVALDVAVAHVVFVSVVIVALVIVAVVPVPSRFAV